MWCVLRVLLACVVLACVMLASVVVMVNVALVSAAWQGNGALRGASACGTGMQAWARVGSALGRWAGAHRCA